MGWLVWDWMVWDGFTCRFGASSDLQENSGYGQSLFLFGTCHPRGDVFTWWQRVPTRESLHSVKFAIIHLPKPSLLAQTVENPPAVQAAQA